MKCDNCLNKYHELYDACPYYVKIADAFIRINNTFSSVRTGHGNQQIPEEWISYDFSCKFYSPKPIVVEGMR